MVSLINKELVNIVMIHELKKSNRFSNFLGLFTLVLREQRRFTSIWTQTLLAPIVTSGLFITVFSFVFSDRSAATISNYDYSLFLAPGILMMVTIQNSFANTSTSILVSKVNGNVVDTLMPSLSSLELSLGFMIGGVLRGLFVATGVLIVIFPFLGLFPVNLFILYFYVIMGSSTFSLLGILVGIYCKKFDQMSAVNNFIIAPLSFLSGTFYSVSKLPAPFDTISIFNPVFWLMDGVRFGALGEADSNVFFGCLGILLFNLALFLIVWKWFSVGHFLKD
ncbi:ABC transporter permease [Paracoccaceae bacterium]|nr:ABC transporter permease [Paracoccaceae bacterium]